MNGAGLTVAVLDTGLNTAHVDFAGRIAAEVNFTTDNNGNKNDANDGNGHGTNVGGIITAGSKHTGIAPGANILPLSIGQPERRRLCLDRSSIAMGDRQSCPNTTSRLSVCHWAIAATTPMTPSPSGNCCATIYGAKSRS